MTLTDLRLLPIAILVVIVAFVLPVDRDLWWHLKTGQLIVDQHKFFSTDPFSWTAVDRTWYLHEWLSEVTLYWVQSNLGFVFDVLIVAGAIMLTLLIVYRLAIRLSGREGIALGLVVLSAVLLLGFLKVRPQAFTWPLFAFFVRQLYLSFRGEKVDLWPLPFLMVLWSNLHLGYLFGLMAMYIWLVSLVARDGVSDLRPYRGPALLVLFSTLAPAISPIGPRALLTPFAYLGSGNVAVNHIQEWSSPDFHNSVFAPLMIAIGLLLVVGLPSGRKNIFGVLLCLVVVGMTLVARRNIALLANVLPIVMSESISQRWPRPIRPPRIGSPPLNWAIAGVTMVATVAIIIGLGGSAQTHAEPRASDIFPSGGVAYVRDHQLGTRMLNTYRWGGYLIYNLYPGTRVSIDGRSDLYGDDILQRYFDLMALKPGWRDELARLDPDFIFLPKEEPLSGELALDSGWKLAFEGHVEMIFVPAK